MKKHTRIVAFVLALLTVVGTMSMTGFAAGTDESTDVTGGGITSLDKLNASGYIGSNDMIVYADFNGFTAGTNAGDDFNDTSGHSRVLASTTGTSFYGNYSTNTWGLFNTNLKDEYMTWYDDNGNIVLKYDATKEITDDSGHFNFYCNSWGNDNGPKDTDFVFQIDAKMGASTVKAAGLFYDLTTKGNHALVNLNSDGGLTVGGNYVGQLSADEYTTVAAYVSPTQGKYWVYINGANVNRAGYTYSNTEGTILKGIRCYQAKGENALMYFDNVQFYYVNRNGSKTYDSASYMGAEINNDNLSYVPKLNEILSSGYADVSDVLFYADFNQKTGDVIKLDKTVSKANSNMYGTGMLYTATNYEGENADNHVIDYAKWYTESDGNIALSFSGIPTGSENKETHLNVCPWGWGVDTSNADTDFVYQMSVKRTAETIWGGTFITMIFKDSTAKNRYDLRIASVDKAGNITVNGNVVGKLEKDKYTTIAVYVDPGELGVSGKYYVYIDGVNVTPDGCAFNSGITSGSCLNLVRCYQAQATSNEGVEFADNAMIFDDIMLYYVNNGASKTYTSNDYIGAKVSALGSSLSMDGMIGVNYYLKANSNYVSDDSALTATFTVNGNEQTETLVKVTTPVEGYKVTAYVPAAEMTQKITGKICDEDGNVLYNFETTTAKDVAMEYVNGDYPEKAKAAAKAMLNYAAAAQTYFGVDANNLANKELADQTVNYTNCKTPAFDLEYGFENETGITYYSSALKLEASTTVYHYFKIGDTVIDPTQFIVSVDGEAAVVEIKDRMLIVKIEGITASDLDKEHTVTIATRSDLRVTLKYSATKYMSDVVTHWSNSSDPKYSSVVPLVKALAVYNQAADAYAAG